MAEELDDLARLLADLDEGEGTRVPTSAFGRLRRTAGAALRVATRRRKGNDGAMGLDPKMAARLVRSLGELKGIAMKMGQILSYIDPAMPDETRRLLSVLQVRSQPTPFDQVEATLRAELGDRADALLEELDRTPVASASIGQVHRGRLPEASGSVDVAVKVRHPGIEDAIRADFKGARVGRVFAQLFAPGSDIKQVIDEARSRFLEECDYGLEARRQARFADLFEDHDVIGVPTVHESWCGERVLTTTWCQGLSFEDFLATDPPQDDRDRVGRALFEFYVGALYEHGLFNADPHPGNLVFDSNADGSAQVVVLDYGCIREFEPETVASLAALSRAVRADDEPGIKGAMEGIGFRTPAKYFDTARLLLRGFYGPVLTPGRGPIEAGASFSAKEVFRKKRALLKLRMPGKLMFLFRIRFGLYAVLQRLGAELDWAALEDEMVSSVRYSEA